MIASKLDHLTGRLPQRYYREFWALRDFSSNIGRGDTIWPDIPRDHLSIAFSIKRGNDVIVSTMQDFECSHLPEQKLFVVRSASSIRRQTGDYLLVAGVQDRHLRDVYYYKML